MQLFPNPYIPYIGEIVKERKLSNPLKLVIGCLQGISTSDNSTFFNRHSPAEKTCSSVYQQLSKPKVYGNSQLLYPGGIPGEIFKAIGMFKSIVLSSIGAPSIT